MSLSCCKNEGVVLAQDNQLLRLKFVKVFFRNLSWSIILLGDLINFLSFYKVSKIFQPTKTLKKSPLKLYIILIIMRPHANQN